MRKHNSDLTTVNRRCVGIDVHKDKFVACFADASESTTGTTTEEERFRFRYKTVAGSQEERRKLIRWVKGLKPDVIIMESTGIYWKAIFREMEEAGLEPMLINPRHFHQAEEGRKTDTADAKWLANLARLGLFRASFVPKEPTRTLRLFVVAHHKNTAALIADKNRLQKILDDAGIHLSTLFSDPTEGKTAKAVIEMLLDGTLSPKKIDEVRDRRCKATTEQIMNVCRGELTPQQKVLLRMFLERIEMGQRHNAMLEENMEHILQDADSNWAIELLEGIPGVNHQAASEIVAVCGTELAEHFGSADRFSRWAGVCPGNNESAGIRKSGRCPHGLATIKTILVECAQAAARTKNTEFELLFRKKKHKGYCQAIMVLAHRLAKLIYLMITKRSPYNDKVFDYKLARALKQIPRWLKPWVKRQEDLEEETGFPDVVEPAFK